MQSGIEIEPISSNAVFHVRDLEKSISFYVEKLGFKVDFKVGSPASYAGLSLGNLNLHLSPSYPYKNNTGHGNIYIVCRHVDGIYEMCCASKIEFYSHIADREYGMRDFSIMDCDGNQVGFGASIA